MCVYREYRKCIKLFHMLARNYSSLVTLAIERGFGFTMWEGTEGQPREADRKYEEAFKKVQRPSVPVHQKARLSIKPRRVRRRQFDQILKLLDVVP